MKIQYASDLHLEFSANSQCLKENPLEVTGDVLVLAGDIIILGDKKLMANDFFDRCNDNYKHTLIVPGNHEYYDGYPLDSTLNHWQLPVRERVTYLNNSSIVIDDTEFFLTTLWAPVPDRDLDSVQRGMSDCRRIIYNNRQFNSLDYRDVHATCLDWLRHALSKSTAARKVVVTHHCPIDAEDPLYAGNGCNSAFTALIEDFVENSGADLWIFGHTHYNAVRNVNFGKTLVTCNQMGYLSTHRGGEPGYRINMSIEI